jgi:putative polyhydroxyalkanoate system protein
MSHIVVHRAHDLTLDQARQAAETLATQLAEHYDLSYHWWEDTLHFERSGVSGHIALEPGMVRINARLGFLLVPLKHRLEQEIHRYLDEMFRESDPVDANDPA